MEWVCKKKKEIICSEKAGLGSEINVQGKPNRLKKIDKSDK